MGGGWQEDKVGGLVRQQSDTSDTVPHTDRQDHHHIANVHGVPGEERARQRREVSGCERKEAERLERVRQVEQTTVHTVITTHEQLHSRHLPALTAPKHPGPGEAVHAPGRAAGGGGCRSGSLTGSASESGVGRPGQSQPHIRSILRPDTGESRAGKTNLPTPYKV